MVGRQRRYILLERDGVVSMRNGACGAQLHERFECLPRAIEALRWLAVENYAAIIISRQGCAGKETRSSSELDAITRRLLLEVALSDGHIAGVYYCRHQEDDGCHCYARAGGLIARAQADHGFVLENTYFIGENEFGLEAATAAGCPSIRIQRDAFLQSEMGCTKPIGVASSLYEAVEHILTMERIFRNMYTAALA